MSAHAGTSSGLASPGEVLAFWFGEPCVTQARAEWFRKSEEFDKQIQQQFGATVHAALEGTLTTHAAWAGSADANAGTPQAALQTLAHIVVLDQFTRNTLRGTARAFAGDAQALALARQLVANGGHLHLQPLQRWFAYLPFEHSESMAQQHESLRLFAALAAEHPALADAHTWAAKHAEVVARFGRYPHRNALLGRESTPDELAFLSQPGSSF